MAADEREPLGQPVARAPREHDDDVRMPRRVLPREDEEIGGGGEKGGDDRERDEQASQRAMARSTASCSSGESATGARPRSTSFT